MFFIEYVWFSDGGLMVKKNLEKLFEFLVRMKEMMCCLGENSVNREGSSEEDLLDIFYVFV